MFCTFIRKTAQIVRLGACHLVSWPNNSSMSEEEEEEVWDPKLPTTDTELEWGEESEDGARQTDLEEEGEPNRQWHSWDWEAVMGEMERLAQDDPQSDSNATLVGADCPWVPALSPPILSHVTLHMPGSPMEAAVEVHMRESDLDDL